jgi:transposase-like protein
MEVEVATKRYSVKQIVAKLRESEKLKAQGLTVAARCKRLGISEQTFFRWRIKYGALKEDEAQRLKALEQENSRLKRIVAEQALDISMLMESSRGTGKPGASPASGRSFDAPLPGLGAAGVPGRRAAPLDAAVWDPAAGVRAAVGGADERARRSASAPWVSAGLGAVAPGGMGGEPEAGRA